MEDPEQRLRDAENEMREKQAQNRVQAVQAVTMKNNLQQQVNAMRKRVDALTAKVNEAEKRGDTETAQKICRDGETYKEALARMEKDLEQALQMTEQVKKAIRYEEETIRRKTREALERKAQWRKSQMYHGMNHAPNTGSNNAADPLLWCVVAAYVVSALLVVLVMWLAGPG